MGRGVESTAMLLAAFNEDKVELLDIPQSDVTDGELLSFEGKEASDPDDMMKSKGAQKSFARFKSSLEVNKEGEVVYIDEEKKEYRMVTSRGAVQVPTLKRAKVQ